MAEVRWSQAIAESASAAMGRGCCARLGRLRGKTAERYFVSTGGAKLCHQQSLFYSRPSSVASAGLLILFRDCSHRVAFAQQALCLTKHGINWRVAPRPARFAGEHEGFMDSAAVTKVLVTGGSGFIAGWCIRKLLAAGYPVRTTVRSLRREQEVRSLVGGDASVLQFVEADLLQDEGWAAALEGCSHVLHLASPFPLANPRNDDELIRPAREGTLRVLRAAREAKVRRVVVTSSFASVGYGHPPGRRQPFTEADWTDPDGPGCSAYIKSKVIAERAAWDFVRQEGQGLELATVNPAAVMGPILGPDLSTSVEIVRMMLSGALPAVPRVGFAVIDVRDVADLHLLAMLRPEAAGERFIAAGPFQWFSEIAAILREDLGAKARKVPTAGLPDLVVRLGAMVDGTMKTIATELGQERPVSSQKAKDLLGWRPRDSREAILASAESLIEAGLVKV